MLGGLAFLPVMAIFDIHIAMIVSLMLVTIISLHPDLQEADACRRAHPPSRVGRAAGLLCRGGA